MDNNSADFQVKLSPIASIAVILILLLGTGGLYLAKPELFAKITKQATNTSMKTLSQESYLPQIESSLKTFLKSAVIRQLIENKATQTEFDAVKDIQIESINADPRGYFKNELAFWHSTDLRNVELKIGFKTGGKSYQAEGEFTVSGASDRISMDYANLVK
ncbi:hypothetical protein [Cerasicoccus arenae]|uniref:Uncharacterized protein n=1 Tax=Cerasicoccus arenae TaxID=424488 RepID=A0A8J3GCU0_9BACT|nr:hypothetical protein [Cerasicoccus arenae]MBK1859772.1 hypothetical protein [Cerasicoccus arenae]GHB90922.1 hypothetical protein GCM10007047_02220 [Cerasicoccus arenae]